MNSQTRRNIERAAAKGCGVATICSAYGVTRRDVYQAAPHLKPPGRPVRHSNSMRKDCYDQMHDMRSH